MPAEATLHEQDIREPLDELFEEVRPEAVFHLAAQADVRVSVERPDYDAAVNVGGTIRVLEAARPVGAQLVFSSTGGAIYGERTSPAPEDDAARAAGAIRHVEALRRGVPRHLQPALRDESRLASLRQRVRPAPGSARRGGRRRDLLGPAPVGGAPKIFGDGMQTRDYVYVGDVARQRSQRSGRPAASSTSAPGLRRPWSISSRRAARSPASRSRPSMRRLAPASCSGACSIRASPRTVLGWRRETSLEEGSARPGARRRLTGLGPAATFVAIRVAFWLVAAATLIWAPAPDRRLIGSAYGPASDFLFRTFAQWDARWFLQIAEHGYEEVPQAAAFFPVYPAAAHALAWMTGSTLVAGVLISLAAGAVAAWALAEIARPILGGRGANDVVLYLALYPVGFVFTALYSDGLFLALAAGSFLAATRGKAVTAGVLGGLATGTRLLGLALLPALVVLLWRGRDIRSLGRLAPLALLPAAVGLYALYLDSKLGDPWAFTSAQADWDRGASPLGPLAGLTTTPCRRPDVVPAIC